MSKKKAKAGRSEKDIELSPKIKRLKGSIQIPADLDVKEAYREYLMDKYK